MDQLVQIRESLAPWFQVSSGLFEFSWQSFCSISIEGAGIPMEINCFQEVRLAHPVIFKSKAWPFWNFTPYVDNIGYMVRSWPWQRHTVVAGKVSPQVEETRTQSSFTSSGSNCMLLQVNLLPLKGMSRRFKSKMVSLNICISEKFPPGLFLSSGHLYKLKSPTRS